jgi:hypothetical protein
VADWVFVVLGYEALALASLVDADLADAALQASGAAEGVLRGLYTLSHSATAEDVAGIDSPGCNHSDVGRE